MTKPTKTTELRKIARGSVFTLPGGDDRYIRGRYYGAHAPDLATFLCQHPASMTHYHFPAYLLVNRVQQ